VASFGNLSLALALAFSLYAIFALFYGARVGRRDLVKSGEHAVYAVFAFVTLTVVALEYFLLRSDFSLEYVASYSNKDLPIFYKFAALWGGQSGSLLFWSWILSFYGALAAFLNRRRAGKLIPYMLGIVSITAVFFLILNKFVANPFDELIVNTGGGLFQPFTPVDGRGLNPLLQHPAMVIHPPMLYTGYVGFVIPFAFCMAALLTRELGSDWIKLARRWTLFAWFILGTGILLGGRWAYVELGWGGYWAWDPVENASLMPWLTGTAFLHSVIAQERKNMLKVWNVSLIIATYMLSIFGTFLTRSGIVSSVHAFARSSIGIYFAIFLGAMGLFSIVLVLSRLKFLKSDNELDSYASREASFLFNNLILLGACFAVFWGTMFPIISEAVQGHKVTVGPPFFNTIMVPIGLFLLFLTGIGPMLAWRKTSWASLRRLLLWPMVAGAFAGAVALGVGVRSIYPVVSFILAAFVITAISLEFIRAAAVRARNAGEHLLVAIARLTATNKRRYGGYIVHFGFVVALIGITGKAFTTEGWGEAKEGDRFTVGKYEFVCKHIGESKGANYDDANAVLAVYRNKRQITTLDPQKRFYHASDQTTSEVRMYHTPLEDLYVVFAGFSDDSERAVFQVWVNPLVSYLWLGGWIMGLGTLFTVLPGRRERRTARRTRDLDRMLEKVEV